jgi:hypothetical protein
MNGEAMSALIGFFKFIENQKDITKRHMTDYVNQHPYSEIIFTPLTKEEVEAGRCSAYEYLF